MMTEGEESPILSEALRLYDLRKWFVIPTDPGAKKPYYGFTYKDRYGDNLPSREEVAEWPEWGASGVRLGMRTGAVSGTVVLDVDSKEAHDFIKAKGHPIGPMAQSPREGGGLHLQFKHPGFYVKSTVAVGGVEGLDIRGDYGIVVLPPSVDHKSGRSYEWIIPPEDVAIPPCPPWLVDILKKQSDFKESLDVPRIMAGIPEGKRDSELNRLAGKFRQMNVPEDVAVPMIELAASKCSPPFSKAAARAKVKWAYTHYEAGEDLRPILSTEDQSDKKDHGFETFTLKELMEEKFDPIKWAVEGLIPEGTMLLTGKPKMGKSWMALSLCIAVATGGKAFNEYNVPPGTAFYLALEDNKKRLQARSAQILGNTPYNDKLVFATHAKRLDSGLIDDLDAWLSAYPDARLVIIDTIAKIRPKGSSGRTLHEQDYEVGDLLTELAAKHNVAILLVHHLKKGDADDDLDRISGSTGLTGGVDGAIVLKRSRSSADGILKVVHRELKDDPEIALSQDSDTGLWSFLGDAEEYLMTKERREIFEVLLNADEAMQPKDIADILEKPSGSIRKLMQFMREDGFIDNAEYGKYVITKGAPTPPVLQLGGGAHTTHSIHSSTTGSGLEPPNPKPFGRTVNGLGLGVNANEGSKSGHLQGGVNSVNTVNEISKTTDSTEMVIDDKPLSVNTGVNAGVNAEDDVTQDRLDELSQELEKEEEEEEDYWGQESFEE